MTGDSIVQLIAALGIGGALTSLIQWLSNRRKSQVDAAQVVTGTALDLLEAMRSDMDSARSEIRILRDRVLALSNELESTRRDLQETRVELQFAQVELKRFQN